MSTLYALDIVWDDTARPGLPTLVGPFPAMLEAQEWAELNIPNGTATLRTLGEPYMSPLVILSDDPVSVGGPA